MHAMQSRRHFLATLSATASVLGTGQSLADERPLETTSIRFQREELENPICLAPEFVAEELLRAEGFTDVR
jgi:NitT/TauT family transport system substrate-binding protein